MRRVLLCISGLFLLAAFAFTQPLPQVTIMLQWSPQSQFAGYYVAFDKGFYRDHGIDLQVLRGGPDRSPTQALLNGEVDFATMFLSRGLDLRDQGVQVVNICQLLNQSTVMIVGSATRGINTIEDLDGCTISLWDGEFNIPYRAFFKTHDLTYNRVPQYYSVNLFLRGGVDACAAMHYNEYHMIYQAGVDFDELTPIMLRDYGVNLPEDGIYCLAPVYEANQEMCRAVAEASLEGWAYARDHQDEALDIVMKYVNEAYVPTNRAHMRWMLTIVLDAIFPQGEQDWTIGVLSEEQYRNSVNLMQSLDLIHSSAPYAEFFRGGQPNAE